MGVSVRAGIARLIVVSFLDGGMMTRLKQVKAGVVARVTAPEGLARAVGVHWYGDQSIEAACEEGDRMVKTRLLCRHDEPALEVEPDSRSWPFDGDGALLQLDSEAMGIRPAQLSDPYLAIRTSRVEPLPHQITAVYGKMLGRQPLSILLTGCSMALFSVPDRLCS